MNTLWVFLTVIILCLSMFSMFSARADMGGVLNGGATQPRTTIPAPCLFLVDQNLLDMDTYYTNVTSAGSTFTLTAWINTTTTEAGWVGAILYNYSQVHCTSVAFPANSSSQSYWMYDNGYYAPGTGRAPFLDFVSPPTYDNSGTVYPGFGSIGGPAGVGEIVMGTATLPATEPYVELLLTMTFQFQAGAIPAPGSTTPISGTIAWDPAVAFIIMPNGTPDPNTSVGNYIYTVAVPPATTATVVSCSPASVDAGSIVNCTATVSGDNATGVITWTTSSSSGSFSSYVDYLSSGTCSTSYVDNNTGYVTITATYSGDANNAPSNGNTTLTIFMDVTTGTNVTVTPTDNVELTFSNVTVSGIVVANATPTVEAPNLDQVGPYYVINVTAGFSGNVTVSVAFDGSNMTVEQKENLTMNLYTPILGNIVPPWGIVNMKDIAYEARHFGTNSTSPNWDPVCDLNGDGVVNMKDIALMARHFGFTATWVNITTYVDTTNNIIYGTTTHFSFIGIH